MKSKTAKMIFFTIFILSVIGWVVFAIFFAPEGFFTSSEPPIAPSTDPISLMYFFLFLVGIAIPILSLLGLAILTILGIQEVRREEASSH